MVLLSLWYMYIAPRDTNYTISFHPQQHPSILFIPQVIQTLILVPKNCHRKGHCDSRGTLAINKVGVPRKSGILQPPCLLSKTESLWRSAKLIAAPQRPIAKTIYQLKLSFFSGVKIINLMHPVSLCVHFLVNLFYQRGGNPNMIELSRC